MSAKKLEIIGIHEYVSLPRAGIEKIESKTDTGAYNSAIDCSFAEEVLQENGTKRLRYILLNENHPLYTGKVRNAKKYTIKTVRSSNGIETKRYQVKIRIKIKGKSFRTTFNLSNRSAMRYPILLGRKMLANRFLVDVSKNRKLNKSKSQ